MEKQINIIIYNNEKNKLEKRDRYGCDNDYSLPFKKCLAGIIIYIYIYI